MFDLAAGARVLQVVAETPLDEIFVIDGGFNRVAKGLGELTVSLPAGVYTVKFKTGESVSEETLVLNSRDRVINRRREPAPAESAVATSSHESARSWLRQFVERFRVLPNLAGGLDFNWSADSSASQELGMVILEGNFGTGEDQHPRVFAQNGSEQIAPAGARSNILALPSGPYVVQVAQPSLGLVSVSLPVRPGWATRIFWSRSDRTRQVHDVSSMRVLMTPVSRGEPVNERDWLDRATASLLAERRAVPDALISMSHPATVANPMLLLCWAHMLLLKSGPAESDRASFRQLVTRLQKMAGDHPDVQLLALFAARDARERPPQLTLSSPPMFWRSWRLLDDPFVRDHVVIAPGSVAEGGIGRSAAAGVWLALAQVKTFDREAVV